MIEQKLKTALDFLQKKTPCRPDIAITLGSGLGGFVETMEKISVIDYAEIPGMPVSTAPSHAGKLVFGRISGVDAVVMQGRVHFYEGYDARETVMPLRVLRMLGAKLLLLTNSAGAVNTDLKCGDFMLVEDHISLLVPSPLRGKNPDFLGPRFPDMSCVYDKDLRRIADSTAERAGIPLRHGVLVQTSGPNFETPAEVRFLKAMGADAVCMSTVTEAMAARHCGYRVLAISCISNMAAGISKTPLTQEEVMTTAREKAPQFNRLLRDLAGAMAVFLN